MDQSRIEPAASWPAMGPDGTISAERRQWAGSTPGGATEVAQSDDAESPVLDGEDELIAYLDGLAVESNSPIVDDLAAVIETLFVTEAASLRESGHTVDVRVDEASGQLTVTLAVAPDAWARKTGSSR